MLRRSVRLAILALALSALAACTLPGFDPTIEDTFTAQVVDWPGGDPTPRVSGLSLREGRTIYYRVELPSARRDLLYAEVVPTGTASGLRVALVSEAGFRRAVSTSPQFFSSTFAGLGGLELDADAVGGRAISAQFTCLGPCAAVRATANSYLIEIENTASSARTFDLYGYTMDASDENEPNDGATSAVAVGGAAVLEGAIESLDDEDWFHYTGSDVRELLFDVFDPALGLELQIDGGGPTLEDGDADVVYPGERFRVRPGAGRAGPSSRSGYTVTIGSVTTPPAAGTVTAQDTTSPSVLQSGTLAANASVTYRVNVAPARDLLYVEAAGSGLRVRLMSLAGTTLAVSDTPAYFSAGSGRSAVTADASLAPSSISVDFVCLGPCAAVRPSAPAYLVQIENLAASARSFEFLAYTFDANDLNDRGAASNGGAATATVMPGIGSYEGAVEWLGDEDWFVYTGPNDPSLFLVFTPFDEDLGLELEFVNCDSCKVLDGSPDASVEGLVSGDVLRVRSATGRAGPAGSSGYAMEVRIGLP